MPVHKTFADFTILFSTHLMQGLPAMYTFGCYEDTPKVVTFNRWLARSGYVFTKRAEDQPMSSYYLNSSLLKETIEHNQITMMFQNNERLRSGKINRK